MRFPHKYFLTTIEASGISLATPYQKYQVIIIKVLDQSINLPPM